MLCPTAVCLGHHLRAMASFTMATSGAPLRSAEVKPRPSRKGIPIVWKYSGSARLKIEIGTSLRAGAGASATEYHQSAQFASPEEGAQFTKPTAEAPGKRRSSVDNWL